MLCQSRLKRRAIADLKAWQDLAIEVERFLLSINLIQKEVQPIIQPPPAEKIPNTIRNRNSALIKASGSDPKAPLCLTYPATS